MLASKALGGHVSHRIGAYCLALVFGVTVSSRAQPPQPRRIVGTRIGGHFELKGPQTVVEYTTLEFTDGTAYDFTIDFIARYTPAPSRSEGLRAIVPPKVVDIVITQHPVDESSPQAAMQVDGRPMPLVARALSARSVVASIPFDDFVKLTSASTIIQRAFDTELDFGAGQRRMLQSVARRWGGR
jgi:hypothetical protein